ncbi:DNA-directed RNA polymerase subunit beta [Paenibacillus validus]
MVTLFIGLSIGYVYIGKQPMSEVFDLATWRHLFDLIFAST